MTSLFTGTGDDAAAEAVKKSIDIYAYNQIGWTNDIHEHIKSIQNQIKSIHDP